jgi:hypothetical protein
MAETKMAGHAPKMPIAVVIVAGANTGLGKTTIANGIAAFFEAAGVPVRIARIETKARQREFASTDRFIDLDRAGEATHLVGAEAALLDEVWLDIMGAITHGEVVVIDCGAGAHRLVLAAAAATGLDRLIVAKDARCSLVVVTTPDAESARQALELIADSRVRMAAADVILAVNQTNPGQPPGADTPQARAFAKAISRLSGVRRLEIPYARAQALAAFAESGRSILTILRATDQQLTRWSGRGELASLAAQAHLAAWFRAVSDQLIRVWPFDASQR